MAIIPLNIPDGQLQRTLDGVCKSQNYTDNKLPGETQAQFTKRMIANQVKNWVKSSEVYTVQLTSQTQKTAIEQDIDANLVIS